MAKIDPYQGFAQAVWAVQPLTDENGVKWYIIPLPAMQNESGDTVETSLTVDHDQWLALRQVGSYAQVHINSVRADVENAEKLKNESQHTLWEARMLKEKAAKDNDLAATLTTHAHERQDKLNGFIMALITCLQALDEALYYHEDVRDSIESAIVDRDAKVIWENIHNPDLHNLAREMFGDDDYEDEEEKPINDYE